MGEGGAWLPMARLASAAFGGCCSACSAWSPCLPHSVLLGVFPPPCVGWPFSQLVGCVRASQPGAPVPVVGALTAAGVHYGRGGV